MNKILKRIISTAMAFAVTLSATFLFDAPENNIQAETTSNDQSGIPVNADNFPDENFRAYISKNIDTDGDGVLSDLEIRSVWRIWLEETREGISVGLGITDLTGIVFFTELTDLICDNNKNIRLPDLSKNTKLEHLSMQSCNLTEIDVSSITGLKYIYLAHNSLKALDLSKNTKLESFHCYGNQIISVKLAPNVNIERIDESCENNKYTVSGCILDIAELESYGFDLSRASNWTNCKQIDDTHFLYIGGGYVQYDYDLGNGSSIKLSLDLRHNTTMVKSTATCTQDGKSAYYHCEKCGYNFKKSYPQTEADIIENIDTDIFEPAYGHDYGSWETTSNPTLKAKGEAKSYCSNDNEHTLTKELPALSDTGFWKLYLDYVKEMYEEQGYELSEDEYNEMCEYYQKAPTMDDDGLYVYDHIDESTDESFYVELTIPSLRNMDAYTRTESIKPTENSGGEFVYTSDDYGTFTMSVPALNDPTWEKDIEKSTEPTEYEEGKDVYHSDIYGDLTIVIPKLLHIHNLTHIEKIPETETSAGTKEHWHCQGCGKNYADENGAVELDDITIPASGHTHKLVHISQIPATETTEGVKEHYHCEDCGRDFLDENGETEATADSLKIGIIKNEVLSGDNAPATKLVTPKDELIASVLSPEEQAAVNEGKDINIILKVEDATLKAPSLDKTAAEGKLRELKNYKLGQYLDVELLKKIGGSESEKITKTNSPIKVMFNIPDSLLGKSEYSVIRIHNGEATVLSDLDSDPNTITIITDRFSTYALAYQDKSSGLDSDEESSDADNSKTNSDENGTSDAGNSETTSGENSTSDDSSNESSDTINNGTGENGTPDNSGSSSADSNTSAGGNPATGSNVSLIPLFALLSGIIVIISQKKNKTCHF